MIKSFKKSLKKSVFFSVLLLISFFSLAQVNLDSLWGVWNDETAQDSSRAKAMYTIAWSGYLFSQPDSAYYFAQMLYEFANEKGIKKEMASALSTQGVSYHFRSDYIKAMDYFQQSLKIYEEISNKRGMAGIMINIGLIYNKQGDYPQARDYFQQSLKIMEEMAEKRGMAASLNNIGLTYMNQSDYPKALNYYKRSLKIKEEIRDKRGMASTLNNIGSIYMDQGNYPKALDYYQRSLKIKEEISDKRGMAGALNNIGRIYNNQHDYHNSLEYYQRSLKIYEDISDKSGMANILNNIGTNYLDQGNYPKALDYFQQSLKIKEEISDKSGIARTLNNIGTIYMNQGNYAQSMDYFQRSLKIMEEISDKRGMASASNNIGTVSNQQGNHVQAVFWCEKGLLISKEINILDEQKNACQCLYDAFKAMGNDNKALEYHERIEMLDDSLQAEETSKKLQQMEFDKQMLADSLLLDEEKLRVQITNEAEVRKKNRTKNIFIWSAVLLLIGAVGLYSRVVHIRRAKKAIENEKDRSDKLLLNILPTEIAEELKKKGRADARNFELVSILFTDFKEFTQISEKLSAGELVEEINTCFEPFDAICKKHGIEKIKTIGDSYMAAGGLPVPTDDSVKNTVLAGLEMAEFMIKRKQEREAEGNICFEMRVGIHTGPVVAGIVGVTKFQYDIWGDTVNIASCMENSGEVGKVNISRSTYEMLKEDPTFKFHSRGKVKAKGKGDIEMWFVEKVS